MKLVFWVAISQCFCYCVGFNFSVGGRDGWVLHPSEDYSHWAGRNRFLVNDTLFFKYKKGEDSVLEVTKDDYYSCNTSNWLLKSENGSSEFKLARSGPFFFISGVKDHCDKGQKLLIIVLSERHRRAVSPGTAPTVHPPSVSPARHRAPGPAPLQPSVAPSPTTLQSPAPLSSPPGESPAPDGSPASSPPSSAQSPSNPVVATPPGSPDEGAPPTPTPIPSPKAAASALSISITLIFGSSLFFVLV